MLRVDPNYLERLHQEDRPLIDRAVESLLREMREGTSGYYALPEQGGRLVEEIEEWLARSEEAQSARSLVVMGIGGSSMGTLAIDTMLRDLSDEPLEMVFLENTDPLEIRRKLRRIDKENTLFFVVSKSGTTIETVSIFKTVVAELGLRLEGTDAQRVIAITDPRSPLDALAQRSGMRSFLIPPNVGGRFSVLSAVGIVPLQVAGYDTRGLLRGAGALLRRFREGALPELPAKALELTRNRERHPMNVLFAYGSFFSHFIRWYQQLWGESLGKIEPVTAKRTGLTPLGNIGSMDQHSFLQLIMQGPVDKTVTFLKVLDMRSDLKIPELSFPYLEQTDFVNGHSFNELINAQCDATYEAVRSREVPTDWLIMERLDEENTGELVMYYQLLTSLCGTMMGIDTYDQPGVELGKRILARKFSSGTQG